MNNLKDLLSLVVSLSENEIQFTFYIEDDAENESLDIESLNEQQSLYI